MQSSLKKSLYLGLAAVSFVAAAGATTANASAKAATVKSDTTMTTAATSRNVNLTGTNAIYTKPGTVKGAKVVMTTATAEKINKSTKGADNFRAYRVAVTDRGSVYYKVVSFDGHYRGYVYGGKDTSKFDGGLVSYNTTKDATAPKSTDVFNLTATTSKDANTLFYAQPAYAQYKIGRATVNGSVLKATDKYAGASFTFDKAATTSREGETWYEIASTKLSDGTTTSELNGAWVKASNVNNPKADPEATNDNSIKVVYQTSNGNPISGADKTFVNAKNDTKAGDAYVAQTNGAGLHLDDFAKANVPAGYVYTNTPNNQSNVFGGTHYVTVAQGATSKANLAVQLHDGATVENALSKDALFNTPKLSASAVSLLTGPKDQTFGQNEGNLDKLINNLTWGTDAAGNGETNAIKYYSKTSTNGQHDYYFVDDAATQAANKNVKYGDNFKIVLYVGGQISDADYNKLGNTDNGSSDFLN